MRTMMRSGKLWQRMIGMLVALLITTLVFGQAAEAFTCNSESATAEAGMTVDVQVSTSEKGSTPKGDLAGLCQHGHCHQTLRITEPVALPDADVVTAATPVGWRESALADGRVYTIDYPPRA
jgi:hypothetical protein